MSMTPMLLMLLMLLILLKKKHRFATEIVFELRSTGATVRRMDRLPLDF
jgi:hypothetical protein